MGFLDILNGMQNGPRGETQPGKGGMSPLTMAILALLAYKAYQKMSPGQPNAIPAGNAGAPANGGATGGGLGDILKGGLANLGPLGGLLAGGAAGSVLSGGLGDLLKQFQQSGHGDVANSWVGTGRNKEISPQDLSKALGDDTVDSLAEQAGLSRIDLLQGLSRQLPEVVDQLTPQGRIPTDDEMSRLI